MIKSSLSISELLYKWNYWNAKRSHPKSYDVY